VMLIQSMLILFIFCLFSLPKTDLHTSWGELTIAGLCERTYPKKREGDREGKGRENLAAL